MSAHRLLLIRHAKSSWDFPSLDDHDRPLNQRGERDAQTMAARLAQRSDALEAVITSTASRAEAIGQIIADTLTIPLIQEPALYTFSARELYQCLLELPDHYSRLAVIGHNPAITLLVNQLLTASIDNIPTSGMVTIDCDIGSWHQLQTDCCRIVSFDYPKKCEE
jgi:phosphohistidine phosphatase